jgi:uncharacterized protein DUF4232
MTDRPKDPIDPYESRLARRVGSFSEQAVVPIDPVAIASAAAVGARRRSLAGRLFGSTPAAARLAAIGAGALLIVVLGAVMGAGGLVGPSQTPVPTLGAVVPSVGPGASPTAVPGSELPNACAVGDLDARITSWDGAAGHRIATVEVQNVGGTSCAIWTLAAPQLVDDTGRVLINGALRGTPASLTLAPNAVATTLVDAANYCGPAEVPPATVAFNFSDGRRLGARPDSTPDSLGGVPPCNGSTVPGEIQMQPFKLAG